MKRIDIVLCRKPSSQASPGELFCGEVKLADTLEAKEWGLRKDVHTCIPKGVYQIGFKWFGRYGGSYPILKDVPNWGNIPLRTGNNPPIDGSILIGKRIAGRNLLQNSYQVFDAIREKIRGYLDNGYEVYMTIK